MSFFRRTPPQSRSTEFVDLASRLDEGSAEPAETAEPVATELEAPAATEPAATAPAATETVDDDWDDDEPVISYGAPVALDPHEADPTLDVPTLEVPPADVPPVDVQALGLPAVEVQALGAQPQQEPVSQWAGDGSTRQKLGHISGGVAPFVTALPSFVRGTRPPALLVLEDGRTFRGEAYGAIGETHGESVFNTGMTGYQETLTDPSYYGQVVAMTAPHIGNTGYNDEDPESTRIWVAGFIVRDPARATSNWRAGRSLEEELQTQGIVGISGIDTRALTRHLRERGAMRVGLSSAELDPQSLLERVLASPGMSGADLAPHVSTKAAYVVPAVGDKRYTVAALDLGIKSATPRYLSERGVEVHVLPSTSTSADLLAGNPDGVFISNGPGDPAAMDYAVDALRGVLDADVPMFGICFGNQILGRAFGLPTYKLRYGHRGINQPVQDRATGRVHVTSHNHGFAVQADLDRPTDTPYGRIEVSHLGLNDNVVEGLNALDRAAFSVQYHPESAAGPHDAVGLFTRFTDLMDSRR